MRLTDRLIQAISSSHNCILSCALRCGGPYNVKKDDGERREKARDSMAVGSLPSQHEWERSTFVKQHTVEVDVELSQSLQVGPRQARSQSCDKRIVNP